MPITTIKTLAPALFLSLSLLSAPAAMAETGAFIGLGVDFSTGDETRFRLGNGDSAWRHGGLYLALGGEWTSADRDWSARWTGGYKTTDIEDFDYHRKRESYGYELDAYAKFSRWPVDVIVGRRLFSGLKLGAGYTYELHPVVRCVAGEHESCQGVNRIEFEKALGTVIELKGGSDDVNFGIRYVNLDYRQKHGPTFDGGGIGIFLQLTPKNRRSSGEPASAPE